MIFIMFEGCVKTCSKIGKNWLLLVHWVAKKSKMNEKIQKQSCSGILNRVTDWCYVNFLKFLRKPFS